MKITDTNTLLSEIAIAVEHWFPVQCADILVQHFLWYRSGRIAIAPERPKDFELADSVAVPRSLTQDAVCAWCFDRLRHAPVLANS